MLGNKKYIDKKINEWLVTNREKNNNLGVVSIVIGVVGKEYVYDEHKGIYVDDFEELFEKYADFNLPVYLDGFELPNDALLKMSPNRYADLVKEEAYIDNEKVTVVTLLVSSKRYIYGGKNVQIRSLNKIRTKENLTTIKFKKIHGVVLSTIKEDVTVVVDDSPIDKVDIMTKPKNLINKFANSGFRTRT